MAGECYWKTGRFISIPALFRQAGSPPDGWMRLCCGYAGRRALARLELPTPHVSDGSFRPTQPVMSAGPITPGRELNKYHRSFLNYHLSRWGSLDLSAMVGSKPDSQRDSCLLIAPCV